MTTQQPPEPSPHDAQCQAFRHMLSITTFLRKQELQQQGLQQGVVIHGLSGVGKTIAVEVFLSAEDKEDK